MRGAPNVDLRFILNAFLRKKKKRNLHSERYVRERGSTLGQFKG